MNEIESILVAPLRVGERVCLAVCWICASAAGVSAADASSALVYEGHVPHGATIEFTVSKNRRSVISYELTGVKGKEAGGAMCNFGAGGQQGSWPGARIVHRSFSYTLGRAISFKGTLASRSTARGTFHLYDPPVQNDPACDTGTVRWTARLVRK